MPRLYKNIAHCPVSTKILHTAPSLQKKITHGAVSTQTTMLHYCRPDFHSTIFRITKTVLQFPCRDGACPVSTKKLHTAPSLQKYCTRRRLYKKVTHGAVSTQTNMMHYCRPDFHSTIFLTTKTDLQFPCRDGACPVSTKKLHTARLYKKITRSPVHTKKSQHGPVSTQTNMMHYCRPDFHSTIFRTTKTDLQFPCRDGACPVSTKKLHTARLIQKNQTRPRLYKRITHTAPSLQKNQTLPRLYKKIKHCAVPIKTKPPSPSYPLFSYL